MSKFIVFEGIDRSGKSTNSEYALDYLKSKGYSVLAVREPGGAVVSEKLREIILDPNLDIKPQAELLLFLASRNQFIEEVVKPSLKKYDFVLCDRFNFSTIAYQGFGRGLDIDKIVELDAFARNGFEADATLYFDIIMDTFRARARASVDRMEQEKDTFFEKVLNGYKFLAKNEKKCYIIDSTKPLVEVTREVKRTLNQIIEG